MVQLLAAAASA